MNFRRLSWRRGAPSAPTQGDRETSVRWDDEARLAVVIQAARYLRAYARGDANANGEAPVIEFPNAIQRAFPGGVKSRAYMPGDVVDGIPLDADSARKLNEGGTRGDE